MKKIFLVTTMLISNLSFANPGGPSALRRVPSYVDQLSAAEQVPSAQDHLVSAPKAIDAQDKYGMTALHWAVRSSNGQKIAQLLQAGASVRIPDRWGWTALHFAAKHTNPIAAAALISVGADVNAVNNAGNTALHNAMSFDSLCMIDVLTSGENMMIKNHFGETPQDFAAAVSDHSKKRTFQSSDSLASGKTDSPSVDSLSDENVSKKLRAKSAF